MFKGAEHKFKGCEHKFKAHEHKILRIQKEADTMVCLFFVFYYSFLVTTSEDTKQIDEEVDEVEIEGEGA